MCRFGKCASFATRRLPTLSSLSRTASTPAPPQRTAVLRAVVRREGMHRVATRQRAAHVTSAVVLCCVCVCARASVVFRTAVDPRLVAVVVVACGCCCCCCCCCRGCSAVVSRSLLLQASSPFSFVFSLSPARFPLTVWTTIASVLLRAPATTTVGGSSTSPMDSCTRRLNCCLRTASTLAAPPSLGRRVSCVQGSRRRTSRSNWEGIKCHLSPKKMSVRFSQHTYVYLHTSSLVCGHLFASLAVHLLPPCACICVIFVLAHLYLAHFPNLPTPSFFFVFPDKVTFRNGHAARTLLPASLAEGRALLQLSRGTASSDGTTTASTRYVWLPHPADRRRILECFHEELSHPGRDETYVSLTEQFFCTWNGKGEAVRERERHGALCSSVFIVPLIVRVLIVERLLQGLGCFRMLRNTSRPANIVNLSSLAVQSRQRLPTYSPSSQRIDSSTANWTL